MEVFGYVISMAILPYLDSLFPEWEFLVRLVKKAIVCQEVSEVKNMVTFCWWELMSPICFGGFGRERKGSYWGFPKVKSRFYCTQWSCFRG